MILIGKVIRLRGSIVNLLVYSTRKGCVVWRNGMPHNRRSHIVRRGKIAATCRFGTVGAGKMCQAMLINGKWEIIAAEC